MSKSIYYLLMLSLELCTPLVWARTEVAHKVCANETAAQLVSLQGSLFVDADNQGLWRQAQLNDVICEGGRVRVEANSRASLLLPEGIILRLDAGTVMTLIGIGPAKTTLLDLLNGFVHFISRTPKRLEITTPIANAGPEGTEFAVHVNETKAELWVYEGSVRFFNAQGVMRLQQGEAAQASVGQEPRAQIDIKPRDAVNWALYYPALLPNPGLAKMNNSDINMAIDDFRRGRINVALAHLDALPEDQHSAYFHKVRGALRLTTGQVGPAMQDISAVQAEKSNDAEALALQSVLALTQNHKELALNLANQATSSDVSSAVAFSALSYAEQGSFELEKALAAAEQAAKLAPQDAMVWARNAELQLALGLNSDAEQSAKLALSLNSQLEKTQTVMGFAFLLHSDTEQALAAFAKAITLDSSSPLARLGLGLAKIRNGDLELGRQELEIAAGLDPNNAIIRSYLGKAYYEEKRKDLAQDQLNLAKERDQKDPTAYFYDAILKQTTNRPVEALQDMQQAINLNDNRAVYRSELSLDKDVAAREAGLGRIYNGLGFNDVANRLAAISLVTDPSNYSALRLLSDSYANQPRGEIARSSAYLQSQLLQPINYNPLQPSLAYIDLNSMKGVGPMESSFNEYNHLFERDGFRLTTTAMGGTNTTSGDESAISGILDKFSFSLGQLHYKTDGFRQNDDLKNNLYNAFAQYQFSPTVNIQAEYRYRVTNHGDIAFYGDPAYFDSTFRRQLNQGSYRFGMKVSASRNSDFLFSIIHTNRNENLASSLIGYDLDIKTNDNNFETQYLFNNDYLNAILGGGAYISKNNQNAGAIVDGCIICGESYFNTTQYFSYLYSNLKLIEKLKITAGLSYDNYANKEVLQTNLNELNPKFGIIWQPSEYITLRVAAFKTVKSFIADDQSLQPVQIAGFNQFLDDYNGTVSWKNGLGIDTHLQKNIYAGIEVYKRDLNIPQGINFFVRANEELYRIYFNWTPLQNMAINSQFKYETFHSNTDFNGSVGLLGVSLVETAYIPTEIRLFESMGFFAALKGTYVNQKTQSNNNSQNGFSSSFYLVDTSIGYRFPKQYGLISLEVKNLFNTNFWYQDRNYQANDYYEPELFPQRMAFARLSFNF